MTIIATCGHEIPDTQAWRSIRRKGYTRQGERAILTEMVCKKCKGMYRAWGDLLETEEEKKEWLSTNHEKKHGIENSD